MLLCFSINFIKNKKFGVKDVGYNSTKYHAEIDAFYRLDKKKFRSTTINLLVIRINKSGELCSSKPCEECIKTLHKLCLKYDIHLSKVYFSTETKTIIHSSFVDLIFDENKHITQKNRRLLGIG